MSLLLGSSAVFLILFVFSAASTSSMGVVSALLLRFCALVLLSFVWLLCFCFCFCCSFCCFSNSSSEAISRERTKCSQTRLVCGWKARHGSGCVMVLFLVLLLLLLVFLGVVAWEVDGGGTVARGLDVKTAARILFDVSMLATGYFVQRLSKDIKNNDSERKRQEHALSVHVILLIYCSVALKNRWISFEVEVSHLSGFCLIEGVCSVRHGLACMVIFIR